MVNGEPLQDETINLLEDETAITARRHRRDDSEMDITPMIDITFLLLIFFLVASKMDISASVSLPPARYGQPVPSKNAVIITVAKGEADGRARIFKGNNMDAPNLLKNPDLVEQEEEITAFVEGEMQGESPKDYVLIKAEKGVKHREVARVARAVGKAETVQQLYVAVLEAK